MKAAFVKLGDVVNFVGGAQPPKKDFIYEPKDGYIRLLQIRDYKSDANLTYIPKEKARRYCTKDDVMIGRYGPPVFQILRGLEGSYNVALMKADPTERVDRNYLYHFLKQDSLFRLIDGLSQRTAGQSGVDMDALREYQMYLPSLSEQKRIAAILDKADAIRLKRQQAIQLADEFLRSVFLDMFGDPVTNSKGWPTAKFSEVGTLDRGKSKHRPRNDPALLGGIYPLIQTGDVANSKGYIKNYRSSYSELGLQQSRMWPVGTLCITIAANIAKTGILTFDACFPDSVVGYTPNERTTVEYVQQWLGFLQKTLEASAPESAQKNINLAILRDLDIPLPDIDLQWKFSDVVKKVVKLLEKLDCSVLKHSNLFFAVSQKAFAGKL